MSNSIPDFICALASHPIRYLYRTTKRSSWFTTKSSPTFRDLQQDLQIDHDMCCQCNHTVCRPWKTHIKLDGDDGKSVLSEGVPEDAKRVDLDAPISSLFPTWPLDSEDVIHLTFDLEESIHTSSPKRKYFDDEDSSSDSEESIRSFESATKRPKLQTIHRIGQRVLASLGPVQTLPSPGVSDIQQLLAQPGMLLVDKTSAVSVIDDCDASKILILRRPRGYGMKTFLSMVSQVYDDLSSPTLIEALYPEYEDTFFSPTHPVLHLDFTKVSADASTIAQSLHEYINSQVRQLLLTYEDLFGFDDVESFMKSKPGSTLTLATAPYSAPVIQTLLLIENYDSPVLRARPDDRAAVLRYMDKEFFAAVTMSHLKGHFVRTILTSEMVTDEYTGIHLDRLERFSIDLTHDAAMQEAFGFTEKEIRALDGALEGKNPAAGDVIQDLHERGIESCNFNTSSESSFEFSGSTDSVYSMQEVLDVLAQRIGKPNRQ